MGVRKVWIGELLYRIEYEMQHNMDEENSGERFSSSLFREFQEYFVAQNNGYFEPKVCDRFLSDKEEAFRAGQIGPRKFHQIRKLCVFSKEYFALGQLTQTKLPRLGGQRVNPCFSSIADQYVAIENERKMVSADVIDARRMMVCGFLRFLEERGNETLETVQPSDIRAFIPSLAGRQPKGIVNTLPVIRKFCALLHEEGIFPQDWASILDVPLPSWKTARTVFTGAEIEKILNAPDKNTPVGFRDATMMLLAARTGLRSIDLVNLKLSDIDWRAGAITIIQRKTGRPLCLPLLTEVGNALSDYILRGRPASNSKFVFLSSWQPHGQLSKARNGIVQKYMKKAGVPKKKGLRYGFHSFRRSVGTRMLEAEVPLETISQVLGHSSTEAAKPYLAVDFLHLKECTLDLAEFPCLRGELC